MTLDRAKTLYLLPITALAINVWIFRRFALDDAWISFRYAANWNEGWGLVYNYGERVEGYTNFLWTILVGLLMRLGAEPLLASRILGIMLGAAILFFVFRLTRALDVQSSTFEIVPLLLVALNVCFAAYLVAGMEAPLFAFFITWGAYRTVVELHNPARRPLSALLFGAATLTRPEGLMLFGVAWVFVLAARLHHRESLVSVVASLLLFGAIFVPYFSWRYSYYGYLLPNTFYAKVGSSPAQFLRGLKYILRFFAWFFGGTTLLIVPVTYLFIRRRSVQVTYLVVTVGLYLAYLVYVGGDGNPLFRFAVPILPLVAALVGYGLQALWQDFAPRFTRFGLTSNQPPAVAIWVACAIVTLAPAWHYKQLAGHATALIDSVIEQGRWLRVNTAPTDTLATPMAGALAYYSELHTYDMLGLTDEHIAHVEILSLGQFSLAGHEKNDPAYIFSKRPTWVWVPTDPNARWIPGTNELVALPGFSDVYEPYRIPLSTGNVLEIYHLKP